MTLQGLVSAVCMVCTFGVFVWLRGFPRNCLYLYRIFFKTVLYVSMVPSPGNVLQMDFIDLCIKYKLSYMIVGA